MEFLLAQPRQSIQFDVRHVMVWRSRRFSPEGFDQAIETASGLLERLPAYLIQQQKEG